MSRLDVTDPAFLAAVTDMLIDAGVNGLEITTPDAQMRLVVNASGKATASVTDGLAMQKTTVSKLTVRAPMAGHFYLRGAFEANRLPRTVAADDVMGFIRVGHLLVPVIAGRAGSLARQLAVPDALVGFGDPLFEIELQS